MYQLNPKRQSFTMKKIGLALSGGGFRASLYHLGLLRFLRDAGILSQVTHITSVSGGSITAAHVVLNWDRYNSSANEFDAAASELLSFVRLDVRNRIVRRFPLSLPLRWPRKLLGRSNRKMTRTGLLEYHYEKYLYGDTSLFELPEKPQLHLLATNLSEGCLCSFSRQGLLMARPQPGHSLRMDRIHVGLATVAMAVTASSAFPGFFPPLELTGADVGVSVGEFGRQAYTDGGVFDNLGVRMFRCLERSLLADSPLCRDDFFDLRGALEVLQQAGQSRKETPLHRLWQVLMAPASRTEPLLLTGPEKPQSGPPAVLETGNSNNEELVVSSLWDVMRKYQFYHDPVFAGLKPADPAAAALLRTSRSGGSILDMAERLWLNRHLLEAAFREATGRACFRRLNSGLDGVLVSDVGKPIAVQSNRRAGGLIRATLRATDILMDRVWQLEKETFHDTPGFVFAPIADVVGQSEDATALHPEIQRQTANLRTDLDRFSALEISSLIRHGYCVCRKACRARPDLFGTDLPGNAPWDPIPTPHAAAPSSPAPMRLKGLLRAPAPVTVEARSLQTSALRRIWSTLLDYRDWTSYVYVPIVIPILVLLPYVIVKAYEHSHLINHIVKSLSQSSHDLEQMTRLLEAKSVPWNGVAFEEVAKAAESDVRGFEILQDSRIMDLRSWNPSEPGKSDPKSLSFWYRRLKVSKLAETDGDSFFYVNLIADHPKTAVRFPSQELLPKLRRSNVDTADSSEKKCRWQAAYDFQQVPAGETVDLIVEYYSPGDYLQRTESGTVLPFQVRTPTAELTVWIMLPAGKEYKSWRVVRYHKGNPQNVERVQVVTEYLADDFTILAFKLLSVKPDYTYKVQWYYK
jgi:predicted acylesterase/phospholipase RssA